MRRIDGEPKVGVVRVEGLLRRADPDGFEGVGNEREVELAGEGQVEERVQGSDNVDGVKGVEKSDAPVCWGLSVISCDVKVMSMSSQFATCSNCTSCFIVD